jgi:hypothetical protein
MITTEPMIEGTDITLFFCSSIPIFVLDCSRAVISLSPFNPNIIVPMEFKRSEDWSLSSRLKLDCLKSLATIEQWRIDMCSTSLCSVQEQLNQSLASMTLGELYITGRTLNYGLYRMNLTVMMVAAPQLISSSMTYVKIISSPITVRLIEFGPAMITRGQQETLTLDPGTYSIDPDQANFSSNVSIINHT